MGEAMRPVNPPSGETAGGTKQLTSFRFQSFPPGAIRPTGWLRDQLRLSAGGLGGHLFDFYRYVKDSSWIGGKSEYSALNEASPYWFNYIVPLAWALDDQRLKDQARQYLDYVLDHQAADGWLGPEDTWKTRGIWARSLLCFGLTQYAEADPTQEDRIVSAMHKFVKLLYVMLNDSYTGLLPNKARGDEYDPGGFGVSRSHELPVSLMWLYENHAREDGQVILDVIRLMFEGGKKGGQDWTEFFVEGVFPSAAVGQDTMSGFTHGVNVAQALRYPTILYRLTGDEALIQKMHDAVDLTSKYQTSLSGSIVADEHLGGLSPQRGSELCMAVESMFSYAFLYRFHGINDFADRVERAAFNALPAGMSPDCWSRQYVTQTNQPWAVKLEGTPPFFNVNGYGLAYGLELDYPCCTVNHPQGFPKYVTNSYVRTGPDGIAHVLLGPGCLTTTIKERAVKSEFALNLAVPQDWSTAFIDEGTVDCETKYPFGSVLKYIVEAETSVDFAVRVPGWTSATASVALNSGSPQLLSPDAHGLHHISLQTGRHTISIWLHKEIHVVYRDGTAAVFHGPLLYAAGLPSQESVKKPLHWRSKEPLPGSETSPHSNDHFLKPMLSWNFAIDPSTLTIEEDEDESRALPNPIFDLGAPPVSLSVDAYPVDWPIDHGTAGPPPQNPKVDPSTKTKLKLVPFASAKLHIAQFPVANVRSV